jgi:hypothetical protein
MVKSGTITNNGTWGITNYNFLKKVYFDNHVFLPMVTFMNISRLRPRARREYLALTHSWFEKP